MRLAVAADDAETVATDVVDALALNDRLALGVSVLVAFDDGEMVAAAEFDALAPFVTDAVAVSVAVAVTVSGEAEPLLD